MALRSGVDTVAYVSHGVYTETYVTGGNTAALYASLGLFEDASAGAGISWFGFIHWFWEFF